MTVLVLLGHVLENAFRCAVIDIFEDERYMVKAATNIGVEQEHLSPDLGQLLGRIAICISQAKVANDYGSVTIVRTDPKSRSDLVLHYLSFEREGIR